MSLTKDQPATKTVLLKSGRGGRRRCGRVEILGGGGESTETLRKLEVELLGEKKRQGSKDGRQKTGR